jgi:hypothetical protein
MHLPIIGVTSGKLMSSYGLKVNGKLFAMFGRKQFVAKLSPKNRVAMNWWTRGLESAPSLAIAG